jgi:sorting nexin-8
MSLFGDDDVVVPSRPRPKQSSSLFDDDDKLASKSGSNLFAEDDSPWGLPGPKKDRRSMVKSLLPAGDVPDSYIDAFDALLESGATAGNGVSIEGVKQLLSEGHISADAQSKILAIVVSLGYEGAGLGRNEFNVLFALLGLAQEGDDITLDSVDERKRSEWLAVLHSPFSLLPPTCFGVHRIRGWTNTRCARPPCALDIAHQVCQT